MSTIATDLLVKRGDLRTRRFAETALAPLAEGEALLRVDCFALTANNVTYAAFGDEMRYWSFFPTEAGWGRVPCWGYGDVVESRAAGVEKGARYYGYYPIGTHLVVKPDRARNGAFTDASAHRAMLPPVYNGYLQTAREPSFEAMTMLFRPLFITSWLIDDFLADNAFFGAKRVILSSASSKTAMGLAWALKRRGGMDVVGLTSPSNQAFVESLGCYDRVLPYGELTALPAGEAAVYVDFSGNGGLRRAVHEHFAANLVHDCVVGAADWSGAGQYDPAWPGAPPAFFFAPSQIEKRNADWGREAFEAKLAAASAAFYGEAAQWMRIQRETGRDALDRRWADAVDGRIPPSEGLILSL